MGKTTGYSYLPQLFRDPKTNKIGQIYRPMIAIRISRVHGSITNPFDALIDSGSDGNLFPLSFANYLGIRFKKVNAKKIYGIGGTFIEAYSTKINIWLGTKKYETNADFSPQQKLPLLGRAGFFDLFKSIRFDEKGQFVYIEEK